MMTTMTKMMRGVCVLLRTCRWCPEGCDPVVVGALPDRHNVPCHHTVGVRHASDVMADVAIVMYKFDVLEGHAVCAEFQVGAEATRRRASSSSSSSPFLLVALTP